MDDLLESFYHLSLYHIVKRLCEKSFLLCLWKSNKKYGEDRIMKSTIQTQTQVVWTSMLPHNMSRHIRDRLAIVSPWMFPNGSVNLPAVKTKFRYKVNSQRFLQEEKIAVHISYSEGCIPSPPPPAATSHFCCYLSSHEIYSVTRVCSPARSQTRWGMDALYNPIGNTLL